jgi:spore coat polysaccharide biosynthesis protein SpsF
LIAAIVQARIGSTRLPAKVFSDIKGFPLIWHVVDRLKRSKYLDEIIIATTKYTKDNRIEKWSKENDVLCFRGSEKNVLDRYYHAAKKFKADIIVRITADDPCKDYKIIDKVIELLLRTDSDYASNNRPPTYPEGMDVEVFKSTALHRTQLEASSTYDKEHVTPYMSEENGFTVSSQVNRENLSFHRWTIDEESDLIMMREIYEHLFVEGEIFTMDNILDLLNKHPDITLLNSQVGRSQLYRDNKND